MCIRDRVKTVNAFSASVDTAAVSLGKMGPKAGGGILKGIAKGLQWVPGLGMIATAGLVIYDVLKDNFFDKAEQDAKKLQAEIAKIQAQAARELGYSSPESRRKAQKRVHAGELLGFGKEKSSDHVTPEQFISRASAGATPEEARQSLEKAVEADVSARLERAQKMEKNLKEALILNQQLKGRLGLGSAEVKKQTANIQRMRDNAKTLREGAQNLQRIASEVEADHLKKMADKQAQAKIKQQKQLSKKEQAQREKEAKQRARMNAGYSERIARSELALIKDRDRRAILAMERRHEKEVALASKHGANLGMLWDAQAAERQALDAKIEERRRKEREEQQKKDLEREKTARAVGTEHGLALASARGVDSGVVDFARQALEQQELDASELERYRSHGLAVEEIEAEQLRRRQARYEQFQANRQKVEADVAANVASLSLIHISEPTRPY